MSEIELIEAEHALVTVRQFIDGKFISEFSINELLEQEEHWVNKIESLKQLN
jgi:hypothetical protein